MATESNSHNTGERSAPPNPGSGAAEQKSVPNAEATADGGSRKRQFDGGRGRGQRGRGRGRGGRGGGDRGSRRETK